MCTFFRLYRRTPSDLESLMTSDKIMRFMSTPPIRASLNFLPYQVYHTSRSVSRGNFPSAAKRRIIRPSSCVLAPMCGGAPRAGYKNIICKIPVAAHSPKKALLGAFGAQIRLFRKKPQKSRVKAEKTKIFFQKASSGFGDVSFKERSGRFKA